MMPDRLPVTPVPDEPAHEHLANAIMILETAELTVATRQAVVRRLRLALQGLMAAAEQPS